MPTLRNLFCIIYKYDNFKYFLKIDDKAKTTFSPSIFCNKHHRNIW